MGIHIYDSITLARSNEMNAGNWNCLGIKLEMRSDTQKKEVNEFTLEWFAGFFSLSADEV